MHLYELLYIIKNDFSDEQIPGITKKVQDTISSVSKEVNIKQTQDLGRRRLAYPIQKEVAGSYSLIDFEAGPESIKRLDRELSLNDDLLRHLIITKQVKTKEQLKREEQLREKAQKAQEIKHQEERQQEAAQTRGTKGMIQKKEELPKKQKKEEETVEQLEQKLDEILKRDIVE